jgi:ferredoxin
MVHVRIMEQQYQVPASLTIMKAFEYAGYRLIRGVGCRGGFCGACGTVYRLEGDPCIESYRDNRLYYALACQTVVQAGMVLTQIPFFPAPRARYDVATLEPTGDQLLACYPDLLTCLGCNTCTKTCPQELEVMAYMADALRGDLGAVAEKSFDCIMCGLCTTRCPAELAPPNVAILARRLYGRYLAPRSAHLQQRIEEIKQGQFDAEIRALQSMNETELRQRYAARDIEPA